MKKIKIIILMLISSVLLSSCATVFSGTKSGVDVSGTPKGAKVYYNGNYEGDAPCKIKVSKNGLKRNETKLKIEAPGYETSEVTLQRKFKVGALIGDIIFSAGIFVIVDFATGAIYKPYPKNVEYNLNPKSSSKEQEKFKNGDKVIFSQDKYKNQEGEIIAVYPNRALIKFTVKNNIAIQKATGKEFSEKEIEVPFINIAKK